MLRKWFGEPISILIMPIEHPNFVALLDLEQNDNQPQYASFFHEILD
jgi:hypothetical protein